MYRRLRKESAYFLSRYLYCRIQSGVSKGMKLYGNLFHNRRPAEFYDEELLYTALDLSGKTIIEAGAHIGIYSLYFGSKATTVIAFEPNPVNYFFLCKNVKANRLTDVVQCVNAGLSNNEGELQIVSKRFNTARSTFKQDKQAQMRQLGESLIQATVPIYTIDQIVDRYGLQSVDFVKIDTEGYEPFVIEGMRKTLSRFQPIIYLEIHGLTPEQRQSDLQRVLAVTEPVGYYAWKLSPGTPTVGVQTVDTFTEGAFLLAPSVTPELQQILQFWQRS